MSTNWGPRWVLTSSVRERNFMRDSSFLPVSALGSSLETARGRRGPFAETRCLICLRRRLSRENLLQDTFVRFSTMASLEHAARGRYIAPCRSSVEMEAEKWEKLLIAPEWIPAPVAVTSFEARPKRSS